MPYPSKKFRQNPFTVFQLSDGQTNRQTDRQRERQTDGTRNITSLGGGNNVICIEGTWCWQRVVEYARVIRIAVCVGGVRLASRCRCLPLMWRSSTKPEVYCGTPLPCVETELAESLTWPHYFTTVSLPIKPLQTGLWLLNRRLVLPPSLQLQSLSGTRKEQTPWTLFLLFSRDAMRCAVLVIVILSVLPFYSTTVFFCEILRVL